MRVKADVIASLWGCPLSEQLSAGRGKLHVCPGLVQPEPARCNRPLDAGAELLARATGFEESSVDKLDIDSSILGRLGQRWRFPGACAQQRRDQRSGWARRTSCGFHVGDMDVLAHALDVDHCAAEATGLAARKLRGQLASGIPHLVFPRCPGAVPPVFVKVGLCAIGEKDPPGFLEVAARLVEAGRGTGGAVPWLGARIEAAAPLPLISAERIARAEPDRTNVYVAIVDQPSSLVWHRDCGGG
jgi:hypothetical protein